MDLAALLMEGTFNCTFIAVPVVNIGSTEGIRIEGHGETVPDIPVGVVVGGTRPLSGVDISVATEGFQQHNEGHMFDQFVDPTDESRRLLGKRKVGTHEVEIIEDSDEECEASGIGHRKSKRQFLNLKEPISEAQEQPSFQQTNFTNQALNKTGLSSPCNTYSPSPSKFASLEQPHNKIVDDVGPSRRYEVTGFENLTGNLDQYYPSSSHHSEEDPIKTLPEMKPEVAREPFVPGFNQGFQCNTSEDFINFVHSSIPLGQQIADRKLPDSEICDRLEADLARNLFSAHELVLRAKQYGLNNVILIGENLNLSNKGIDSEANVVSESQLKELQTQLEDLKGRFNVRDNERQKTVRSIAEVELEKKKVIDNLEQHVVDLKQKERELLENIGKLEAVCAATNASKEVVEKGKREVEMKNAELEVARVKAEGQVAALHDQIATIDGRCRSLEEFKDWIVGTGLQSLYKKIKSGQEFVSQAFGVNQAMKNLGFQQGLEVGYERCSKNIPVNQAHGYDHEAAKVKEVAYIFQNSESTLLEQIVASKDASIPDLKQIFSFQ